jgi:hypothetical protein
MQRALELDVEDPAARDRSGWVAARLATADVREHELCMPPRDEESLAVHVLVAVLPDPRPRHAGSGAERRREPRRTRGEEREPVGSLVDEVDRGAVHVTEERVARSSPVVQRRRYPVSVDVVAVVAEREEAGDDAAAPERSDPEVVGGACDPLDVGRRRPVELQPSDASRPRSRCRRRRAAPLSRPPQRLSPRSRSWPLPRSPRANGSRLAATFASAVILRASSAGRKSSTPDYDSFPRPRTRSARGLRR